MQKHHFALAVALLCAAPVYAQTPGNLPTNYLPVEQKQYGNSYQWTPAKPAVNNSGALYGPNRGYSEISNAEPKINTYQKLPYDNRANIPDVQKAKIVSPFTKANFGKALTFGARQLWPIGAVITAGEIYEYLNGKGYFDLKNTPDGIIGKRKFDFSGFEFSVYSQTWYPNPYDACDTVKPITTFCVAGQNDCYTSATQRVVQVSAGSPGVFQCHTDVNYRRNYYEQPVFTASRFTAPIRSRTTTGAQYESVTQQQIEDQIAQDAGWPTSAARALQKALEVPGNHLKTEPPTVTGPSSIPGTTTTTTQPTQVAPGTNTPVSPGTPGAQPATQTTTTTNTTNNTYNGDTVTTTNVSNTTTTITNNVTNTTTTTNPPTTTTTDAPPPPEIETCGLPGKPACKIDETGTPEAKPDTAEADAKKAYKPLEDFVANPTRALPTFPTINWAFTLPSGCAPIALPAFEPWLQEIDVCAFQPMFHDLMSFVWVMGGIFGAIGTFWRNTFSQG